MSLYRSRGNVEVVYGPRENNTGLQAGEKNPMYGRTQSEETRKKIRTNKSPTRLFGEKNPNYGKHHPEERKKQIGDAVKGEKNGMYGVHRFGEKNPMYGRTQSEKARRIIGAKNKGRLVGEKNLNYGGHFSEERKKRMSDAHKGKRYSPVTEFKKGQIPWNKGLKGEAYKRAITRH